MLVDGGEPDPDPALERGDGSHHPEPPRFVTVGEGIVDPNGNEMETRDDLAPRNPDGDADYRWRVLESPANSTSPSPRPTS